MSTKPATAAERRHLSRIASMPCVLCECLGMDQMSHTTVHHLREGQGTSQRASHWLTIPLCDDCHQVSKHGMHGDRQFLKLAKVDELDMLAMTIEKIARGASI